MSIYEYMPRIGYKKHESYPNGFERPHGSGFVSICIVFNFKERTIKGLIKPSALIRKQKEIDEMQKAYYQMVQDLETVSKVTGCKIV